MLAGRSECCVSSINGGVLDYVCSGFDWVCVVVFVGLLFYVFFEATLQFLVYLS